MFEAIGGMHMCDSRSPEQLLSPLTTASIEDSCWGRK